MAHYIGGCWLQQTTVYTPDPPPALTGHTVTACRHVRVQEGAQVSRLCCEGEQNGCIGTDSGAGLCHEGEVAWDALQGRNTTTNTSSSSSSSSGSSR